MKPSHLINNLLSLARGDLASVKWIVCVHEGVIAIERQSGKRGEFHIAVYPGMNTMLSGQVLFLYPIAWCSFQLLYSILQAGQR